MEMEGVEEEDPLSGLETLREIDTIEVLAQEVFEEIIADSLFDLISKVYRVEKIARAKTATMEIEAMAAQAEVDSIRDDQTPHLEETLSARYDDGEVYLRGNPMRSIPESRCSKCGLFKILDPIEGIGAVPLAAGDSISQYCTRHPYISKFGHDIYGNPFPTEDSKAPRKGIKLKSSQPASQPDSSFESSTSDLKEDKTRSYFPTTTCPRESCKRQIPVRDFRRHLLVCMGISSRASGRAAAMKASSTSQNNTSSQTGSPAPQSRKGTPLLNSTSFNDRLTSSQKEKEKEKRPKSPTKRIREYPNSASSSSSPDLSSVHEDEEELSPPIYQEPLPAPSPAKKNKLLAEITDFLPLPNKPRIPTIKLHHKSWERKSSIDKAVNTTTTTPNSKEHKQGIQNGHDAAASKITTTPLQKKVVSQGGFNGMMGQLGTVKKWKSGNVTLDGKRVERRD